MNITQFFRIIARHYQKIVLAGLVLGTVVYLATLGEQEQYESQALINTGIVSGYNIESQGSTRTDYTYTNNEILNLINLASSNETLFDLSKNLLVVLVRNSNNDTLISKKAYQDFSSDFPKEVLLAMQAAANDSIAIRILEGQLEKGEESEFYKRIHSKDPLVGLEQLQKIKVVREGTSDMIRITYQTIDPGVCQKTIEILMHLFISKHKGLKQNQTTNVLEFFENSTKEAAQILSSAEDELLNFQEQNRIINYYEQTRYISGKKEDLDEQYYTELMNSVSADSSIRKIEKELGRYVSLPQIYREIDTIRKSIASNSSNLMALDLQEEKNEKELANLRQNNVALNDALRNAAMRSVSNSYTSDGLETKSLLSKWLDQLILREQSAARIKVMNTRKGEFELLYDRFAPLGSRLKHIERKIDVSEKEYLENLHSLNQAQLHKYNMMISSNLSIVDRPNYPALPEKSKRMLMVVLAFLAGIFITVALILALELLDQTLRNPYHAEKEIGYEVIAAIPMIKEDDFSYPVVLQKSVNQFLQYLMLEEPEAKAVNAVLLSTRSQEGKSRFASVMEEFNHSGLDLVFQKLPSLLNNPYNVSTIQAADYVFLVVQANRIWTKADRIAIERLMKANPKKFKVILNGVSLDEMEEVIGEIPKKRSRIRKWIKRAMNQELNTEGMKIA